MRLVQPRHEFVPGDLASAGLVRPAAGLSNKRINLADGAVWPGRLDCAVNVTGHTVALRVNPAVRQETRGAVLI